MFIITQPICTTSKSCPRQIFANFATLFFCVTSKEAVWSLECVYCSRSGGIMVQFNNGQAEAPRPASPDTDYTHAHCPTIWGWVWPAVLLRRVCRVARPLVRQSSSLAEPSPRHGGCAEKLNSWLGLNRKNDHLKS